MLPRTFRFVLIVILLLLAVRTYQPAFAQSKDQTAKKFDEFGDVAYSDMIARLDGYASKLMTDTDARGFIIVYRTRRDLPGLSHSLAIFMKQYMTATRGVPKDRLVTIDGGVADCLTRELWIVPTGSAPTPRSDARIGYFAHRDSAWKFDEFGFEPGKQNLRLGLWPSEDKDADYLEAYAMDIKKNRHSIACLITYSQYNPHPGLVAYGDYEPRRDARLDPPGTARRRLDIEKRRLLKIYGIHASRIRTIDGGYRKHRTVELWIVPAGEPLPIPTPNSFPKRRTVTR